MSKATCTGLRSRDARSSRGTCPVLEQALVGREWLEGTFSIADIAFAPHLWILSEGGFDLSATPGVRAWLARVLARSAWRSAVDMVFGA